MNYLEEMNMLLQAYRSNFYMTIRKKGKKNIEEYIEYYPVDGSIPVKYHGDISTTLMDIVNNLEYIVDEVLMKYRQNFHTTQFNNYNEIIGMMKKLKDEILNTNKHFCILTIHIDELIWEIEENKEALGVEDVINSCLQCIFSLIEELQIVCTFTLASYFRTFNFSEQDTFSMEELKGNKDLHKNVFEMFRGDELYLPRVTVLYNDKQEEEYTTNKVTNRKGVNKKEIVACKYSIFSLSDLMNTTLYYLQNSNKAILCCAYCGKYFIRKQYDYKYYDEKAQKFEIKTIVEKNSKKACSKECAKKLKKETVKRKNSTGYRHEIKNLRIKLKRVDDNFATHLKVEFEDKFHKTKKELEDKFGYDSEEVEEELLKFVINETEEMKQTRKKLKDSNKK